MNKKCIIPQILLTSNIDNLHDSYDTVDIKVLDSLYSVSRDTCCSNFKENWMGLAMKDTKNIVNYVDKYPEWDSIESQQVIFISVVKNESLYQFIKLKGVINVFLMLFFISLYI